MKKIGLNQLREQFLSFFEGKAHLRQPSAPLVPLDDHSLLLINSGMAPLKNYFLGLETPPSKRLTTCQKCIRTPDIEQVGKTSRHGTFFEMLGNFSFGDYFKEEATEWAWEFMTQVLEIPEKLIWVTVYQEDDEAYDIWKDRRGVDPGRIVRLGKADNFWEIGSGPCGPCSEIYIDRGEQYTCDAPECGIGKCECDRYMEVWNLVFTQFNSDGEGNYTPLEHPNIDTGMGLERLACVMQGVDNLFEVDTVQNIMNKIGSLAGVEYHAGSEETDVSLRVVTDHIRSTVFLVGDGVIPSNEGRGYVLRRLLRRAARHGRLLGIEENFLGDVCETVIEENKGSYPELEKNREYIKTIIQAEEERFAKTIAQGMEVLSSLIDRMETLQIERPMIDGAEVFRLHDTFGFPLDLTREIAEEHGLQVDEEGFIAHMKAQRDRARKAHAEAGGIGWEEDVLAKLTLQEGFVGYEQLSIPSEIGVVLRDNQIVDQLEEGQEGILVLTETPFYSEGGGQVGDRGVISFEENIFAVEDCRKSATGHYLHIGRVTSGRMETGNLVVAKVDAGRRGRIMRNHTATHLLQAALRLVLGNHVHQAGSYVDPQVARFDFTHFSGVTPEELAAVEKQVNDWILASQPVTTRTMAIDAAQKIGAMALFGDKYSEMVRVAEIPGASIELCGGTHVENTAQIGLFKILSESSVAAGVRRIEATTSLGVLELVEREQQLMEKMARVFKVNAKSELLGRARSITEQVAGLESKLVALEGKIAKIRTQDLESNTIAIGSVVFAAIAVVGEIGPLQQRADEIKERNPNFVGVMIAMGESSATVLAFAGAEAVKAGIHCGKLVKEITALGGGSGGGRPDNAKGGIADVDKVDNALAAAKGLIEAQLGL